MFGRLEEFVWSRHRAYEIVPPCEFKGFDGEVRAFGRRIVAVTDECDDYCPLKEYPNLFRAFANIRSEAELFAFVRMYGSLTDEGQTRSHTSPNFTSEVFMINRELVAEVVFVPGDLVDRCLAGAAWCAHVLRYQRNKDERYLGLIEKVADGPSLGRLAIEIDPQSGARLVAEPKSLLDGIRLQLLESISKGDASSECERCGNWFSRKMGAKFCSAKCKIDFHNEAKKQKRLGTTPP